MGTVDRCHALLKSGKRCRNRISHKNHKTCKIKQHIAQYPEEEETFETENFTLVTAEKTEFKEDDVQRLLLERHLRTGVRVKQETPGFIYIFRLQGDQCDKLFKVGMTRQASVSKRMKQWQKLNTLEVVEVAQYSTDYPVFVERMVHLLLFYRRVYRYIVKKPSKTQAKQFHTEFIHGKLPHVRTHQILPKQEVPPATYRRRKKEVEWFHANLDHIEDVIRRALAHAEDQQK